MKGRLESLDFVKGLLIVLVVWGHICAHSSGIDYEKNMLTSYIRLFQMPMFILISGFFQKTIASSGDLLIRVRKTFLNIGLPLFVWALIASLVMWGLQIIGLYDFSINTLISFSRTVYANIFFYWFLPCLIICILLNAIIGYVANRFSIRALYLHIASIPLILLIPIDMFYFQFMWPFFILGIYLHELAQKDYMVAILEGNAPNQLEKLLYVIWGGVIICSLFWPTKYTFYNINNYIFLNNFQVVNAVIFIILRQVIYIVATLVTLYFILKLYYLNKDNRVIGFISNIGKETLFIYLFHLLIVAYLFGVVVKQMTNGLGLMPNAPFLRYYVLDVFLTLLIIMFSHWLYGRIGKSKLMSKLLLGK